MTEVLKFMKTVNRIRVPPVREYLILGTTSLNTEEFSYI